MSAGFLISDPEWLAKRQVDHLARDLYDALRRAMDFETGIVGGPAKGISWWSLREDTEVPGRPGVKAYKPSEQQLRRRMAQLEKAGLVESIGTKLRLKFRLLLARTSSLASKKADTGTTAPGAAAKAKPVKRARAYPQGNNEAKAGTHLVSGKTKTQPKPPRVSEADVGTHVARVERDIPIPGAQALQLAADDNPEAGAVETGIDLAPHACGAGGEQEPPTAPTETQRLSEERQQGIQGGGDGPSARLAGGEGFEWQDHRAWPMRLDKGTRRKLANELQSLGKKQGQRVLDEWRGAMQAGGVQDHWAYFYALLRKAEEQGDAWVTVYADKIALAREVVQRRLAEQKARDAAFAATLDGNARPPSKRGELRRRLFGGGA